MDSSEFLRRSHPCSSVSEVVAFAFAFASQEAAPHGAGADNLSAALRVMEGEAVYDYCWFPNMSADNPVSCCFATTTRARPVHMW